jgi:predicted ATP-grasp superfamily ATP-dependent carboligase
VVDFFACPEDRMRQNVLILGASTRAAAHSAIRAGLTPICADFFADADLRSCAQVVEVDDYPRGLIAAAARAPACPWIYTGGLENHPNLVARISADRRLWGNGSAALRAIRDPWQIADLLSTAGLPACRVWPRNASSPPAADGRWMLKPFRGAAGRGIRVWDRQLDSCTALRESHYFQERRAGSPVSSLFLAARHDTLLLGITRQLVGLEEVHAPPFAWCGTMTPIRLPATVTNQIESVGRHLGRSVGLRGLFGCDFLVDEAGAWLTEVNPRYPASTELVECTLTAPLLDWHRRACESFCDEREPFVVPPSLVVPPSGGFPVTPPEGGTPIRPPEGGTTSAAVLGKIVLYADRDLVAPDLTRFISRHFYCLPYIADIPVPGTRIERSQPICTVFARAETEVGCVHKLIRRSARIYSNSHE